MPFCVDQIHSELHALETRITISGHTLHCSRTGILCENILENFMDEKHRQSLHQPRVSVL